MKRPSTTVDHLANQLTSMTDTVWRVERDRVPQLQFGRKPVQRLVYQLHMTRRAPTGEEHSYVFLRSITHNEMVRTLATLCDMVSWGLLVPYPEQTEPVQ